MFPNGEQGRLGERLQGGFNIVHFTAVLPLTRIVGLEFKGVFAERLLNALLEVRVRVGHLGHEFVNQGFLLIFPAFLRLVSEFLESRLLVFGGWDDGVGLLLFGGGDPDGQLLAVCFFEDLVGVFLEGLELYFLDVPLGG